MTEQEELEAIEEFLKMIEDNADELEEKANMAAYLVSEKFVGEGSDYE